MKKGLLLSLITISGLTAFGQDVPKVEMPVGFPFVNADPDVSLITSFNVFGGGEFDVNFGGYPSAFYLQAQTACETGMLRKMGAREVFSGKGYDVLTEVAQAYGRKTPHIYIFPGGLNMGYIAGSTAVDGRGKIIVGQQAIKQFDAFSLEGFLGHEMAHLVSDTGAQGCNDYIIRNPKVEADADALAARTLGMGPVRAFLQRVLVLTQGQYSDAKYRLEMLQSFRVLLGSQDQTRTP